VTAAVRHAAAMLRCCRQPPLVNGHRLVLTHPAVGGSATRGFLKQLSRASRALAAPCKPLPIPSLAPVSVRGLVGAGVPYRRNWQQSAGRQERTRGSKGARPLLAAFCASLSLLDGRRHAAPFNPSRVHRFHFPRITLYIVSIPMVWYQHSKV